MVVTMVERLADLSVGRTVDRRVGKRAVMTVVMKVGMMVDWRAEKTVVK